MCSDQSEMCNDHLDFVQWSNCYINAERKVSSKLKYISLSSLPKWFCISNAFLSYCLFQYQLVLWSIWKHLSHPGASSNADPRAILSFKSNLAMSRQGPIEGVSMGSWPSLFLYEKPSFNHWIGCKTGPQPRRLQVVRKHPNGPQLFKMIHNFGHYFQ